jgi:hypothetical protein
MVTGWVSEWRSTHATDAPAHPETAAPAVQVVENSYNPHRCYVCGKVDPRYVPETISVHTHCRIANLDPMIEAFRGSSD